jgi:hypothetical protein
MAGAERREGRNDDDGSQAGAGDIANAEPEQ